jgi:hypothetical protein
MRDDGWINPMSIDTFYRTAETIDRRPAWGDPKQGGDRD